MIYIATCPLQMIYIVICRRCVCVFARCLYHLSRLFLNCNSDPGPLSSLSSPLPHYGVCAFIIVVRIIRSTLFFHRRLAWKCSTFFVVYGRARQITSHAMPCHWMAHRAGPSSEDPRKACVPANHSAACVRCGTVTSTL